MDGRPLCRCVWAQEATQHPRKVEEEEQDARGDCARSRTEWSVIPQTTAYTSNDFAVHHAAGLDVSQMSPDGWACRGRQKAFESH